MRRLRFLILLAMAGCASNKSHQTLGVPASPNPYVGTPSTLVGPPAPNEIEQVSAQVATLIKQVATLQAHLEAQGQLGIGNRQGDEVTWNEVRPWLRYGLLGAGIVALVVLVLGLALIRAWIASHSYLRQKPYYEAAMRGTVDLAYGRVKGGERRT